MFGKKSCKKCRNKINDSSNFCPHCGTPTQKSKEEDWGLLGKDDQEEEEVETFSQGFLGNMNEKILGKMLNGAMRMLEKEMQKEMSQQKNNAPRTNIRLMINGKEITLNNQPQKKNVVKKVKEISTKDLPQNKLQGFSDLPKEEPKTNIRRLSNKVVYEIEMPGVKSQGDISIIKLESSIEIKALGKGKAYYKTIPINLAIMAYKLSKEKLTLELEAKN